MLLFHRIRDIISDRSTGLPHPTILSLEKQVDCWYRANDKMAWGIQEAEFENLTLAAPPASDNNSGSGGFDGISLFYGFGDDGLGNSDAVLSGKLAWEHAIESGINKTWQCGYIDFCKPKDIRLRPGAPARPKGFYYADIHLGHRHRKKTVSEVIGQLADDTGCGPEGLQLLAITHCHLIEQMNVHQIPFMALADYEVAPRSLNDFSDAPQIFCCDNRLGLGIGNVDRNYPLFGVPTLRFRS